MIMKITGVGHLVLTNVETEGNDWGFESTKKFEKTLIIDDQQSPLIRCSRMWRLMEMIGDLKVRKI